MHGTHPPDDLEILTRAPRHRIAHWPTPVEELQAGLWVKRDDLCGYGRGGAKARKIEHLLGHLLADSVDELITVAGNVTNLAFDLLPVLDEVGIQPNILITDDPPISPAARAEVFDGILDRISLVGQRRLGVATRVLQEYLASRSAGRSPFMLLPGASHPSAVIGNACGFLEMVEQFREQGLEPPRTVFITAATGNTIAGFLIAESALRAVGGDPIRIIGVQVYPGSVRQWTWLMLKWTRHFAGLAGRIRLSEIEIDASTLLDGFGHFSDELAGVCARVEREFGFDIDPIFGGKTWHVMDTYRKDDRVSGPVLYWHCGYTPEWRALGSRIDQHRGVA